jgi:hypothetical protein
MSFTGNENHDINLLDAAKLTSNYRHSVATGSILGGYFGRTAIERILDQEGCVGIRYYYALSADGAKTLVLVGVNADENDLVHGELAEISWPCPPYCSDANALNS